MKSLFFILFLFVQIVTGSDTNVTESKVLQLSVANSKDFIDQKGTSIVYFYTPWSADCKRFNWEFETLSMEPGSENIRFAKVDTSTEIALAIEYKIKKYPSVVLFLDGKQVFYDGEMKFRKLSKWITKHTNPVLIKIESDEYLAQISNYQIAFLLFSIINNDSQKKEYEEASKKDNDNLYYYTELPKTADYVLNPSSYNLIAFRSFNEGKKSMSSRMIIRSEEILTFVAENKMPFVLDLTELSLDYTMRKRENCMLFFFDPLNLDNLILQSFEKIAELKSRVLHFIKSDGNSAKAKELKEMLDVHKGETHSFRIVQYYDGFEEVYHFLKQPTEENLLEFIEDYQNNKLFTDLRSEPVPEVNDSALFKVVGRTFEEVIMAQNNTILMLYIENDCVLCDRIKSWLIPFIDKLKKIKHIVYAEFNTSSNEHPRANPKTIPAIEMWVKNQKNEPIHMYEDHNPKGFEEFIFRTLHRRVDHMGKFEQLDESL